MLTYPSIQDLIHQQLICPLLEWVACNPTLYPDNPTAAAQCGHYFGA